MQYRQYGSGQAKLSFLKNVREDNIPEFVNLEEIENLANEDAWFEFQDIPLGAWADKNLRQMAIESDCKAVYDAHFDWASGYVHGNWASVRDTVYVTCVNPLHRLHRIPSPPRSNMASILNDAFKLINRMLDELNHLYPSFKPRIRWHKQRDEKAV